MKQLDEIKGEFVVLVEGSSKTENEEKKDNLKKLSLEEHYEYYSSKGFNKKDIIKQIAKDRGLNKNEIYQYFLNKE